MTRDEAWGLLTEFLGTFCVESCGFRERPEMPDGCIPALATQMPRNLWITKSGLHPTA
jgi:hypothetical protein